MFDRFTLECGRKLPIIHIKITTQIIIIMALIVAHLTVIDTVFASERLMNIEELKNSDAAPTKIQGTGKRESIEHQINGTIQGKARYYHPNGQLYTVIQYVDGKKTGFHTLYREDGTKEQEINYIDNQFDGVIRWFDQKGALYFEATYNRGNLLTSRDLRVAPKSEPKTLMDKTFDGELSIAQLISIATKPSNKSNEMENIKRHAYKLLLFNWEQNSKSNRTEICAAQKKYLVDWQSESSSWLKVRAAELILNCPVPKDFASSSLTDLIMNLVENAELGGLNNEEHAKAEKIVLKALELLPKSSSQKQNQKTIHALLEMLTKQIYSNRIIFGQAKQLDLLFHLPTSQGGLKQKPKFAEMEVLVQKRFKINSILEEHYKQFKANKPNESHTVTIWDFASESEVKETLKFIDRIICSAAQSKPTKSWSYSYVIIGRSENNFRDSLRELTCKI